MLGLDSLFKEVRVFKEWRYSGTLSTRKRRAKLKVSL